MENNNSEVKNRRNNGGLFIAAGLFIGLGVGFAFNLMPAALFIGMGLGFIAMAIWRNA